MNNNINKTVHFVCTGNIYRSRLAETYYNSRSPVGWVATSSGVLATNNESGDITWFARRIMENEGIFKLAKPTWTQTTKELLDGADHIVFMTPRHFAYSAEKFGFAGQNYEIWNVKDVDEMNIDLGNTEEIVKATDATFQQIKQNVDELIAKQKQQ